MNVYSMFVFMRTILVVCGVFFAIVAALLVLQLILLRKIARQSQTSLGRLVLAHNLVGAVLAGLFLLLSLLLFGAAFMTTRPIPYDEVFVSDRADEAGSGMNRSVGPTVLHGPHPSGMSWGRAMWKFDKFKTFPKGDGIIEGRILLDGKGAHAMKIRLLLNKEYYTPYVLTDDEGTYRIKAKRGEYSYDGWDLGFGFDSTVLNGKVLIDDGVIRTGEEGEDCDEETGKEIEEILEKYPFPEAQEKIQALFEKKSLVLGLSEEHLLKVTDEPAKVPPLCFVTPIEITFPPRSATVKAGDMRIEWAPVPDAAHYCADIGYEKRHRSGGMSYLDLAVFPDRARTSLSAEEFLSEIEIVENRRYTVEITAYEEGGKILSRSSPYHYFKIE